MCLRILGLSNFYPPYARGGYEQWCEEVTETLRARGHDVAVLTSKYGVDGNEYPRSPGVHRELRLEMQLESRGNAIRFFTSRRADERKNLDCVRRRIAEFAPDSVLIWGMWNVHRSVAALVEQLMPNRVAYYIGDYWPTLPSQFKPYWESPARSRLAEVVKTPLRAAALRAIAREPRPVLRLKHAMFPTAFMRDELARRGIQPEHVTVVYGAIDTRLYTDSGGSGQPHADSSALRLLTAGRLTEDKGVHTAIEALATLVHGRGLGGLQLAIVGSGDASYERRLRDLATTLEVDRYVSFLGAHPKEAMPTVYRGADVFLFTSIWPEPFGRVVVEAMASGLVVVGTATGGASEILADEETALVFEPGDAAGLADRIERLARHLPLRQRLAECGRERAVDRFDIQRMTSEIEGFLEQVAGATP